MSCYDRIGKLARREAIGLLEPRERRRFDVDTLVAEGGRDDVDLVVFHRLPTRYSVDQFPEPCASPDRHRFHSHLRYVIDYARAGGGHGSVLYEIPAQFNVPRPGRKLFNLTFAPLVSAQAGSRTLVVLLNYSTAPDHQVAARFSYEVLALDGGSLLRGETVVGPFCTAVVELPAPQLAERPGHLTFLGHSADAVLIPLFVTLSDGGGVSVEHSHPPQTYIMSRLGEQGAHAIKNAALKVHMEARVS